MPVAKLSREFYERFGDKLTDELVNCLNAIEGSYRAELRDLFDAHFGRSRRSSSDGWRTCASSSTRPGPTCSSGAWGCGYR